MIMIMIMMILYCILLYLIRPRPPGDRRAARAPLDPGLQGVARRAAAAAGRREARRDHGILML